MKIIRFMAERCDERTSRARRTLKSPASCDMVGTRRLSSRASFLCREQNAHPAGRSSCDSETVVGNATKQVREIEVAGKTECLMSMK